MPRRSNIVEKREYVNTDGSVTRAPFGESCAKGVRYLLKDGRQMDFDLNEVSEPMLWALAAHGLNQRIGDLQSASSVDSPDAFHEAAMATWKNLTAHEPVWSARGGDGGPSLELRDTARAYAELKGIEFTDALAVVTGEAPDGKGNVWEWTVTDKGNPKAPERYRAFRKLPAVREKLADYAKERAGKGSTDADLDDF
jgi:hypothetical protein